MLLLIGEPFILSFEQPDKSAKWLVDSFCHIIEYICFTISLLCTFAS
jgi:hypothetical protein